MEINKQDLINALRTSIKELQRGIDMHCCLISSILKGELEDHDVRPLLDVCAKHSRELILKDAIKETIDILEESRKSFKSKRPESLRKKLTQVLINAN